MDFYSASKSTLYRKLLQLLRYFCVHYKLFILFVPTIEMCVGLAVNEPTWCVTVDVANYCQDNIVIPH